MNLLESLHNLRTLEPNREHTERLRTLLVGRSARPTLRTFITEWFEAGSAIALAGLFILFAVGGFSLVSSVTPFGFSSLDPAGLRVEAQAIDIQIQLSGLNYQDVLRVRGAESTPSMAGATRVKMPIFKENKPAVGTLTSTPTSTPETSTSTPEPTLDEVLRELAK